jgi:hypothetical protein
MLHPLNDALEAYCRENRDDATITSIEVHLHECSKCCGRFAGIL